MGYITFKEPPVHTWLAHRVPIAIGLGAGFTRSLLVTGTSLGVHKTPQAPSAPFVNTEHTSYATCGCHSHFVMALDNSFGQAHLVCLMECLCGAAVVERSVAPTMHMCFMCCWSPLQHCLSIATMIAQQHTCLAHVYRHRLNNRLYRHK
eukprot:GHUV01047592.1.p1 GENE.GHUV01047592.1~~GHUV01047592.1.p1  ORF type:complete len:149 (+),score=7.07 GHUV01047592.1:49-495(+)